MTFLYPAFLWTLCLISIPIIIHLFNFRIHKLVYFSNLNFLKDIKDVSESKSKLKQLVLLLLRILLITSLVIAFSGPYIPLKQKNISKSEKVLSIYLDNSFSMNAESIYGNLFDAAKERARKIVSGYDNRQKFLYTDNNFDPAHRVLTNKEQVIEFINQATLSPSIHKLSEIINYQNQYLSSEYKRNNFQNNSFLISDFQEIISDFQSLKPDSNNFVYLIPLSTSKINNLFIDSCWFESPGRSINKLEELNVQLFNSGDEDYDNIPLKLFINGKQKAVNSFSIEKNSSQIIKLNYTNTKTGILSAMLEITDYPIIYDNKFYFNYHINEKTRILIINKNAENKYLKALFDENNDFILDFEAIGSIKTSVFPTYQLIILDEIIELASGFQQELRDFVQKGGSLVFAPSENGDLNSYNQFFNLIKSSTFILTDSSETEIAEINYKHYIYRDVFKEIKKKLILPKLKSHYKLQSGSLNLNKTLIKSINNNPLLIQGNYGKGKFFVFTFSLNIINSDFILHPLYVPTLFNIAAYSQSENDIYYNIGESKLIDINIDIPNNKVLRIVDKKAEYEFIPRIIGTGSRGVKLDVLDQLSEAGNYHIVSDMDTVAGLAFNFDRKESNTDCYNTDEIKILTNQYNLFNFSILSGQLESLSTEINELVSERKDLWKIFIILALIFIIAEVVVIKFWKE
ncbi:MAG: BatA domain-containing protein [Bacteroidota bacterium]